MTVNGAETPWREGLTVEQFITQAGYDKTKIAVECNGEIVPKACYSTRTLSENDSLEIVSFVGGG